MEAAVPGPHLYGEAVTGNVHLVSALERDESLLGPALRCMLAATAPGQNSSWGQCFSFVWFGIFFMILVLVLLVLFYSHGFICLYSYLNIVFIRALLYFSSFCLSRIIQSFIYSSTVIFQY